MVCQGKLESERPPLRQEILAHEPHIPHLPRLTWLDAAGGGDAKWSDNVLSIRARPRTDWFNNPSGVARAGSAPVLSFSLNSDLRLSVRVRANLKADFDAAFLLVHQTCDDYARLNLERSPGGLCHVTSVVTRGASDDAVGPIVEQNAVRLMVSRFGPVIAFYFTIDNLIWRLLRIFRFRNPDLPTCIGFCAQSPVGSGSEAHFDDIVLTVGMQPNPRGTIKVELSNSTA